MTLLPISLFILFKIIHCDWTPYKKLQSSLTYQSVSFAPSDKYFATVSSDGCLQVWDAASLQIFNHRCFPQKIYSIAISKTEKYVGIGGEIGVAVLHFPNLTDFRFRNIKAMQVDINMNDSQIVICGFGSAIVLFISDFSLAHNHTTFTQTVQSCSFSQLVFEYSILEKGHMVLFNQAHSIIASWIDPSIYFYKVRYSPFYEGPFVTGNFYLTVFYLDVFQQWNWLWTHGTEQYAYIVAETLVSGIGYTAVGFFNYQSILIEEGPFLKENLAQSTTFSAGNFNFSNNLNDKIYDLTFSNKGQSIVAVARGGIILIHNCLHSPILEYHFNCQQICGDGLTAEYVCDNAIGVPYDGCNDDCSQMDDFQCTIYDTYYSHCRYLKKLNFQVLELKRKSLTGNQFEIVLSVYPPLAAFAIIGNLNLTKMFAYQQELLSVNSCSYNEKGMQIYLSLTMKKQIREQIEIAFEPNNSLAGSYFSYNQTITITKQQITTLSFIKPQNIHLLLSFYYFSFLLLGFYSILFFIGMFSRSLAALESLITVHYCFLTIVWLKCKYFDFIQFTRPLKYLFGFNIGILGKQNYIKSFSNPFLYQFKISQYYLSDNFNLVLIPLIIILLAVGVTTIRLHMFKQKFGLDENLNGDECFELEKLEGQKYFWYFSLLYYSVGMFVSFIGYFMMFLKFGQLNNVESWMIFSFNVVVLSGTLKLYFWKPYYFQTFRSSFQPKRISINHYFYILFSLLLSIILLSTVSHGLALCPISLIFMMLYTLVSRPYISMKENIRSSFNFFVMTVFSCLAILVHYQTDEWIQDSKFVVICLIICVFILLTLVLVIGSLFCFKSFCEFIKSMQYKNQDILQFEREKEMKILKELVIANLKKKMKKHETNSFFNMIVGPNESIKDFSNRFQKMEVDWQKYLDQVSSDIRDKNKKEDSPLENNHQRQKRIQSQIISEFSVAKKNKNMIKQNEMNKKTIKKQKDWSKQQDKSFKKRAGQTLVEENTFINYNPIMEKNLNLNFNLDLLAEYDNIK